MDNLIGIFAVFLLVGMNGFFVAAEFAFVGARRTRITQLAEEGSRGAQVAQEALLHLDSYIAATQLGITLASLGLGWIGEPAIAHLFEPLLHVLLPPEAVETVGHTITFALAFSLVTMLHIVFGELAPKSIALQRPEATSVLVSRPARLFLRVFRPIIYVMNTIGNGVVRLLGFQPAGGHAQVHSSEELVMLIESSRQAGVLLASEEQLLRRVFDFAEISVAEVMQPRVEVDAIPVSITLEDLMQRVRTQHHSRYPVYEESIDNIAGMFYTKDLLDLLIDHPEVVEAQGAGFSVRHIMREPLAVPQTLSVDKVLERMRQKKTHLVIVLDEYGGMAGIATMEDILEELVGEVADEFEEAQNPAAHDILDGMTSISTAEERFGELDEEAYSTTLGGYFSEKLERMPVVGDAVEFCDYLLKVEAMDGMRVAQIRVMGRKAGGANAVPGSDAG